MFLHGAHSCFAVVLDALKAQINRRRDGWTNKETDLFYLSCSRLFPFAGAAAACDQRGSGCECFSESYHSVCDIRLRGPPATAARDDTASVLTRREIIGLLGYCEIGRTFHCIPIFSRVFKPFSTSESSHRVQSFHDVTAKCVCRRDNNSCTNPLYPFTLSILKTDHGEMCRNGRKVHIDLISLIHATQ